MDTSLTKRLEACYTGAVHDVMRGFGLKNFVLPKDIQALFPERTVAGPVFTVSGSLKPGSDGHETLLAWTGFLSKAPSGHVVVCQPNDDTIAHMGELSAETLKLRGVAGFVVDGGCRDVSFVDKIGFPVFCRYTTPIDVVGAWTPDTFEQPINIGTVTIDPGDYIIGDRDGVVIIPGTRVEEVIAEAERVMATENKVRTAILGGMDPKEAYLEYGKF